MSENKVINGVTTRVDGQELVIERVFNAPRDLVFKAFSNSEYLANWWGPRGWQTENRQFKFEPNGVWHYCMRCIDESQGDFFGHESWGKAVFQEINAPEKIVYMDMFADEEGNTVDSLPEVQITMEFLEHEGKTKLISRSQFTSIEALQQVMEMGVVEGVASQYECLDDLLNEIR